MALFNKLKNLFSKNNNLDKEKDYDKALLASRNFFTEKLNALASKYRNVDENFIEELTQILIMSDISVNTVDKIVENTKTILLKNNFIDEKIIKEIVVDEIYKNYANEKIVKTTLNIQKNVLNIFLMVGVNGTGKTTSIAKLAYYLKQNNYKVAVCASDTFRAAAVEQLKIWSTRADVEFISSENSKDPSAVIFQAIDYCHKNQVEILICDSAGRLENKVNLMNELAKMTKTISKKVENAPQEILLTIDATTGQNGINQAKVFKEVCGVTGIILTKMDGTSKGGIVLSIHNELNLPVKFIGLGEKLTQLKPFDLDFYIYNLVKDLT